MLRFIDGFDHYNTMADLQQKWSSVAGGPTITSVGSRFGVGNYLQNPTTLTKIIDAQGTWTIGCAFYHPGTPSGDTYLVQILDGATIQMEWGLNSSNQIIVARNGTKLATSSYVCSSAAWHYIEFKVFINSTTGTYEVRADNVSVVGPTTGANTQASGNATADRIVLNVIPAVGCYYDDVYMVDGQSGVNNTFLGDCRIYTVMPSGAGNYTQWTPDTGSNFARVNESPENGDTSYVSSSTVNNIDSYVTAGITGSPVVFGVQMNLVARKDDAGTRQVATFIRKSATDYVGTTQGVVTTYAFLNQMYETNPNTSAQWLYSEVNAAEWGVKLIT